MVNGEEIVVKRTTTVLAGIAIASIHVASGELGMWWVFMVSGQHHNAGHRHGEILRSQRAIFIALDDLYLVSEIRLDSILPTDGAEWGHADWLCISI